MEFNSKLENAYSEKEEEEYRKKWGRVKIREKKVLEGGRREEVENAVKEILETENYTFPNFWNFWIFWKI